MKKGNDMNNEINYDTLREQMADIIWLAITYPTIKEKWEEAEARRIRIEKEQGKKTI